MAGDDGRYGEVAGQHDCTSRETELFEESLREGEMVPEQGFCHKVLSIPPCEHFSRYMLAMYDWNESGHPPVCPGCGRSWYWSDLSIAKAMENDVSGA